MDRIIKWEAKIPTAGGWWILRKINSEYSVYSCGGLMSSTRHCFTASKLSDVYNYLATQEREYSE